MMSSVWCNLKSAVGKQPEASKTVGFFLGVHGYTLYSLWKDVWTYNEQDVGKRRKVIAHVLYYIKYPKRCRSYVANSNCKA